MTYILAAAWLSAALIVVPAAAETPASPPPDASTSGSPPADPRLERQRNSAAKLAGMVRFVDASCPQAKPDYDRFKQVVAGLGVDLKDLENGQLMVQSLSYTQAYQKEGAASCERAVALFGASGTVVAGLVVPRPASEAPPVSQTPPGQVPAGQAPAGQAPADQVPAGKAP